MDASEDQLLEKEALESIFFRENEFIELDKDTIQINLKPQTYGSQLLDFKEQGASLIVHYTKNYPWTPPDWYLKHVEGIDSSDLERLRQELTQVVADLLGHPMVFSMAERIQNFLAHLSLHSNNNKPTSLPEYNENNQKSTSISHKDVDGLKMPLNDSSTPVRLTSFEDISTDVSKNGPESQKHNNSSKCITQQEFLEWKETFRQRMIESGRWAYKAKGNRLTGKQLFEQNDATTRISLQGEESVNSPLDITPAIHWENKDLFSMNDFDPPHELFNSESDSNHSSPKPSY